jgi:hypothetical protein
MRGQSSGRAVKHNGCGVPAKNLSPPLLRRSPFIGEQPEHLRSLPKMEYHSLTPGTLLKNRLAIKITRLNYFHVCRLKYCKRNYCSHAKAAEQQRPLGVGARLVERAERASEWVDDLLLLLHEQYEHY